MRITKGQGSVVQRADNAIKRLNRQISVKEAYFFVVIVLLSFLFSFLQPKSVYTMKTSYLQCRYGRQVR